jgi:curved DNA-binding protein CbpA
MNPNESEFFKGCGNQAEIKRRYLNLVKQWHPDLNKSQDTTKIMQRINSEYELIGKSMINEDDDKYANKAYESAMQDMIAKVIHLEGITIEIIGSWLWLSGATRDYKDLLLKELGFGISKRNNALYWYDGFNNKKRKFRGNKTMEDKRNMYGSIEIETKPYQKLG